MQNYSNARIQQYDHGNTGNCTLGVARNREKKNSNENIVMTGVQQHTVSKCSLFVKQQLQHL